MRLALFALPLLAACWNDREAIGYVTWSDDDQAQAYQLRQYEESSYEGPFGRGTRDHHLQVWVQSPNGAGRRALSPMWEGTAGTDFYFMRQAGYVLLDRYDGPGSRRWELVGLDGTVRTAFTQVAGSGPAEPCTGGELLPSPDGAVIARIERVADSGCLAGTLRVTFVDADSLTDTASHEISMDRMPGTSWTRDGDFLVWTYGAGSWRVDPVDGFVALSSDPTCVYPRTSSSALSDAGVRIMAGTPSNPIAIEETDVVGCW